ncbi:hypothetical protein MSAN_00226900 [Mycena sanguinolenta]|uniref:Uncharacterized protein n=1 Tax=Mycena sanguinolenta TaxID=230812 RepID=A0A8H6ZFH1_9AGAR|nr:hypothetical protein MSAN_00226900 [Mycena sanguinolenta]
MSGTKRSRSPEDIDSSRKVVKTAVGAINPVRRSLLPAIQPVRRVVKCQIDHSDSKAEEIAEKPPGPPPPVPREGGRPSHQGRGVRTDHASPALLTGLSDPHTPPPKKRKKGKKHPKTDHDTATAQHFLTPQSSRIAAFTTQQPAHFAYMSPPKLSRSHGK